MQPPLVVEVPPRFGKDRTRTFSRASARMRAVILFAVVAVLALCFVGGLYVLSRGQLVGLGMLVFPPLTGLPLYAGARMWWRAANRSEGEHFELGVPHAFVVEHDRIHFPHNAFAGPESWLLAETTVEVVEAHGVDATRPVKVRDQVVARQAELARPGLGTGEPGQVPWEQPRAKVTPTGRTMV